MLYIGYDMFGADFVEDVITKQEIIKKIGEDGFDMEEFKAQVYKEGCKKLHIVDASGEMDTPAGHILKRVLKPIDLQAGDPVRYVSDMLAWLHQNVETEQDALGSLIGKEAAPAEGYSPQERLASDEGSLLAQTESDQIVGFVCICMVS
eukprot:Skav224549  [mRNA]  locus=scaffold2085:57713:67133:+ [translate_table: standard]